MEATRRRVRPLPRSTGVTVGVRVALEDRFQDVHHGMVNDATHTFSTLPFAEQVLVVIVALFVLYVVVRRAF